jgi:hypothetical protein
MAKVPPELIRITEEREFKRFSLRNIISSFLATFNLERGLWFTLKAIFLSLHFLVDEYLGEGRLKFIAPFRILILTTGLALVLLMDSFLSGWNNHETGDSDFSAAGSQFFQNYFNTLIWIFIPILALISYWFNRIAAFNYAENLVIWTYLTSVGNILTLLMFRPVGSSNFWAFLSGLLTVLYFVFYYHSLYPKSWFRTSWESLVVLILSFIIYVLITTVIIFAYSYYVVKVNPAAAT